MCVSLHTAFTHPHESRSRKAPCPANPSYAAPRYLGVKRRHFYFLLAINTGYNSQILKLTETTRHTGAMLLFWALQIVGSRSREEYRNNYLRPYA
ncbi:hypothetical protein NDU88_002111 [Pleurodeles waltl]|uniref:Uncharacterized protein n=1 Tax=Pleurodeles waltl TaxID=8319 RepID=A0AAV7WPP8_PLEWA|nr:hypothetical protein NDU88_002111 [Pleurodeles waltl]